MNFFVKDFCETLQARVVIFGEQLDNDVLYRGIANQPSTSCNVGLKMDILLFVLPCIFLFLYFFRQRYQPYALEALKRGYSQIF